MKLSHNLSISISSIAITVVLWTVCVNGFLPPVGLETSQMFYLLFAAVAPTLAATIALMCNRDTKLRINIIDALVVSMVTYMCISITVTGHPQNMLLAKIALLFTLYINLRIMVAAHKRVIELIVIASLLLGIYQCSLSAMQLFGNTPSNHGLFQATGSFHNPGPLGGFLAMIWGVALFHILQSTPKDWWRKIIYIASIVYAILALLILPATQSRIAWIAAILVTICIVLAIYGSTIKKWILRHRIMSSIGSLAAVTIVVIGATALYNMKKDSADGRLLMWKTTSHIIADHPLLGVGFGSYAEHAGTYQADYFASGQSSEQEVLVAGASGAAFNDYLQCTAELGLVGLFGLLSIAVLAFLGLSERRNGLQFALLALAVFAMASYPLGLVSFGVLGTIILSVGASEWRWKTIVIRKGIIYSIIGVVVLINIGTIIYVYPLKESYKSWGQVQLLWKNGNYAAVKDDYAAIEDNLSHESQFLFEYGKILNETKDYVGSNQRLYRVLKCNSDPMIYNLIGNNFKYLGNYNLAEHNYYNAYYTTPNRVYPLYLLTLLYHETGQVEKMRAMRERVLNFAEKVPSTAVRQIKANTRKLLEND